MLELHLQEGIANGCHQLLHGLSGKLKGLEGWRESKPCQTHSKEHRLCRSLLNLDVQLFVLLKQMLTLREKDKKASAVSK